MLARVGSRPSDAQSTPPAAIQFSWDPLTFTRFLRCGWTLTVPECETEATRMPPQTWMGGTLTHQITRRRFEGGTCNQFDLDDERPRYGGGLRVVRGVRGRLVVGMVGCSAGWLVGSLGGS
jgi:hypothetical protein